MAHELYHAHLTTKTGHAIEVEGLLKLSEFQEWSEAENAGDLETCVKFMSRFVVAWDYTAADPADPTKTRKLDPKNLKDWQELEYREWKALNVAVGKWLRGDDAAKN